MRYRLVETADLPRCLGLFDRNGRCVLSPTVREHLPRLWSDWLAQDRHFPKPFALWEDLRGPGGSRIEAIGLSHFVRDDVHDLLLRDPRPYLLDRLYRLVLDGHRPCLDLREIARANAGAGLSLVMPLYLQREHDLGHPDSLRLRPIGPAAWYFCHAGYNVRRIHGEVYGRPAADYMAAGGFRVTRVFDAPAGSPVDGEACQHVIDRTDLPAGMANAMSLWVMHPQAPVLGLSPSQQTVATRALQGDTDRVIAARLGISTDAVKQSWRAILRTVSAHMPELCADTSDATAADAVPVRGTEHRRIVVEYLRQHMEELRPWSAAGGMARDLSPVKANSH